ncbi:MAG: NYN domain-containing protein [Planctomycetota bacterium]|nr:NYN domain-containing protein [Planctomycetota bacterium]
MIIIDGCNLLWSIQGTGRRIPDTNVRGRVSLSDADEESEPISEVQLCRIIGGYLKLIGESGEIIFDGAGPRDKSAFDNITNAEVFFAGPGRDADTVIEGKIKANTAPRRLVIVSSDRRLRRAARVRGAAAVKSQDFWERLQKELSRKKTTKEPAGKRHRLTESETKQWLEFLGFDE